MAPRSVWKPRGPRPAAAPIGPGMCRREGGRRIDWSGELSILCAPRMGGGSERRRGGEPRGSAPSPAALCALRGGPPLSDRPSRAVTQRGPASVLVKRGRRPSRALIGRRRWRRDARARARLSGLRREGAGKARPLGAPGACLRRNGGSGAGDP